MSLELFGSFIVSDVDLFPLGYSLDANRNFSFVFVVATVWELNLWSILGFNFSLSKLFEPDLYFYCAIKAYKAMVLFLEGDDLPFEPQLKI